MWSVLELQYAWKVPNSTLISLRIFCTVSERGNSKIGLQKDLAQGFCNGILLKEAEGQWQEELDKIPGEHTIVTMFLKILHELKLHNSAGMWIVGGDIYDSVHTNIFCLHDDLAVIWLYHRYKLRIAET